MRPSIRILLVGLLGLMLLGNSASAQRRSGGTVSRASARSSVNRNVNVNRNANINRNVNVNVNRNVDVHVHGGYYGYGGCCYHSGPSVGEVVAATVVTAVVIGAIVHSLPPSCTTVVVGGLAYQQCGSTWYQPQFVGTTTSYVVVAAPR